MCGERWAALNSTTLIFPKWKESRPWKLPAAISNWLNPIHDSRPRLFITAGLVGSGKSTLSQALAKRLGLTVISSDIVRKRLAAIPTTEHRFEEMESGIYSAAYSRRTYDKLFSEARKILSQGDSVILDASFIKADERGRAQKLAEETGRTSLFWSVPWMKLIRGSVWLKD